MLAQNPLLTCEDELSVAIARTLPERSQDELRKQWIHAVNRDTNSIGWLPTQAWDTRHDRGDTYSIHRNDDLVGWSMAAKSPQRGVMKIYQIWVRPDARILEHGRALTAYIGEKAFQQRCWRIEAWVAEDIDANFFWPQVGFQRTVWRWGRGDHPRKLHLWIAPTRKTAHTFQAEKTLVTTI